MTPEEILRQAALDRARASQSERIDMMLRTGKYREPEYNARAEHESEADYHLACEAMWNADPTVPEDEKFHDND